MRGGGRAWDDDVVDGSLSRRAGRTFRKVALVVMMLFAAIVAPIAIPIRMIVELVKRDSAKTEQIVLRETRSARGLGLGEDPPHPSTA
jgi:hypothetical protein